MAGGRTRPRPIFDFCGLRDFACPAAPLGLSIPAPRGKSNHGFMPDGNLVIDGGQEDAARTQAVKSP